MNLLVHVNGRLVPEDEARLSVFDRGFLFGDGLFESMRSLGGTVFRIDRHQARLRHAAALVGFEADAALAAIPDAIRDLLRANRLTDARIRVTVTRGPGRPGDYASAPGPATVVISAAPFVGIDPDLRRCGVAVAIPVRRQVPAATLDPSIKTTSRLHAVLARREAQAAGAFEAVLLDEAGHLTEGTVSNLFLVAGGVLLTPPAPGVGLPGVTRGAVLEIARAAGLPAREEPLRAERLRDATEAFLTNTSWEVLPAVRFDGRPVGAGLPGPVTVDLAVRFTALMHRECAGD